MKESTPQIGMVGMSHKTAPVETRECFAFNTQILESFFKTAKEKNIIEMVYIATCNRIELYFVSTKIEEATQLVINLLEQFAGLSREYFEHALYKKYQKEAVEKGLKFLKPLLLKNIADEVGVHESTVSRIVSNKYMLTPSGTFLMRDFFMTGIKAVSGELKSVEEIKRAILEIIEKENKQKPFSDSQISELLYRNYRIFIARRTVAKYREDLNIPCYKDRKRS